MIEFYKSKERNPILIIAMLNRSFIQSRTKGGTSTALQHSKSNIQHPTFPKSPAD